jgi:hypothetical protein
MKYSFKQIPLNEIFFFFFLAILSNSLNRPTLFISDESNLTFILFIYNQMYDPQ